ncbi:hypothetical protein K470DRAFT_260385 [Piedraia hortae CBS 480.64]|uniref:Uncharacterized protein n=1 Tax=Piedraia hortae CBS 480.64 TaxID=1314780 RepID=A0A6A7BT03_9PEZI|nr:hypothetical protein K470DRAFT_260385 [Piedraia hortae CBS 480.64]
MFVPPPALTVAEVEKRKPERKDRMADRKDSSSKLAGRNIFGVRKKQKAAQPSNTISPPLNSVSPPPVAAPRPSVNEPPKNDDAFVPVPFAEQPRRAPVPPAQRTHPATRAAPPASSAFPAASRMASRAPPKLIHPQPISFERPRYNFTEKGMREAFDRLSKSDLYPEEPDDGVSSGGTTQLRGRPSSLMPNPLFAARMNPAEGLKFHRPDSIGATPPPLAEDKAATEVPEVKAPEVRPGSKRQAAEKALHKVQTSGATLVPATPTDSLFTPIDGDVSPSRRTVRKGSRASGNKSPYSGRSTPVATSIRLRGGSVVTVVPPEATAWQRSEYTQGPIAILQPVTLPRKNSVASLEVFEDAIEEAYQQASYAGPRRPSDEDVVDDICDWFDDFYTGGAPSQYRAKGGMMVTELPEVAEVDSANEALEDENYVEAQQLPEMKPEMKPKPLAPVKRDESKQGESQPSAFFMARPQSGINWDALALDAASESSIEPLDDYIPSPEMGKSRFGRMADRLRGRRQ